MPNSQNKKDIYKIVITGGPCAGKTTSLKIIKEAFEKKGYWVLSVDETATQLFTCGAELDRCKKKNKKEYQYQLAKLMFAKEDAMYAIAQTLKRKKKILIVCDRGALDNQVYIKKKEFDDLLNALHTTEAKLLDRYHAVFHLVTAANGAEEHYGKQGNDKRRETAEEAIILDSKLIEAWNGHPHIRIIDNKTDFDQKMRILIHEIAYYLGEPKTVKTRKKYLIKMPDTEQFKKQHVYKTVEIEQTYLKTDIPDEIIRLRQRKFGSNYTYYKNTKRISDGKRTEEEARLTRKEYLKLRREQEDKQQYKRIKKQRYYLSENGLYYSIDIFDPNIFPEWKNQALMEIEVYNAHIHNNDDVQIPEGIEVIENVSGKKEYTNPYIARIKK